MTCRKCESPIYTGTKCFQCGYDNAKPMTNSTTSTSAKHNKRSPAMIVIILLFILCIFIFGLSKKAFKAYAILTGIGGFMRIINNISILFYAPFYLFGTFLPFILKGLLLFVVYKTDGKLFGFGKSEKDD